MDCVKCNSPLAEHLRNCQVCQMDNGFPNVRIAKNSENITALQKRYDEALVSITARDCEEVLKEFQETISLSRAVICKNLIIVNKIISSDNNIYTTYQKEVSSGARLPESNEWDFARPVAENTIFSGYSGEIHYAALTIDDRGLENYGKYHIILKEELIGDRASAFNENSIQFCKKHKVVVGNKIPLGYRSTWTSRAELAVAKLHSKLDKMSKKSDFPKILLNCGLRSEDDDFIEVHIYGGIHRRGIEKVIGPKPSHKERALYSSIKRKLSEVGAIYEEIPWKPLFQVRQEKLLSCKGIMFWSSMFLIPSEN